MLCRVLTRKEADSGEMPGHGRTTGQTITGKWLNLSAISILYGRHRQLYEALVA